MNNQVDKKAQIETSFGLHSVTNEQVDKMQKIRDKAKEFAYLIVELSPVTREQSIALTELETAVFYANAAIARNE